MANIIYSQKAVTVNIDSILNPAVRCGDFDATKFPHLLDVADNNVSCMNYCDMFDIIFNTSNCGCNDVCITTDDNFTFMSKYITIDCNVTDEECVISVYVDANEDAEYIMKSEEGQKWIANGMLTELIDNIDCGEISVSPDGDILMTAENARITNKL